jgi:hypothetical protein
VITWATHVAVKDAKTDLPLVQAAMNRCVAMAEGYWAKAATRHDAR